MERNFVKAEKEGQYQYFPDMTKRNRKIITWFCRGLAFVILVLTISYLQAGATL